MSNWTPTITERRNDVTQWALEITYTHPEKKPVIKSYKVTGALTDEKIKHIVRSEIAQLDAVEKIDALTLDKGDVVDISPAMPVAKSPELAAREKWQKDYGEWMRLKSAAFDGFISQTDKRISDLHTSLKAGWIDEYKDLL